MIRSSNSKSRRSRPLTLARGALYVMGGAGFLFLLALIYETLIATHNGIPSSSDGAGTQTSVDNLNEEVRALTARIEELELNDKVMSQQLAAQAQSLWVYAEAGRGKVVDTGTSPPALNERAEATTPPPVVAETQNPASTAVVSPASVGTDVYSDASYFFLSDDNVPDTIKNARAASRATCNALQSVEKCGCQLVAFLGGMKCGSTNLATRLKHKVDDPNTWDPKSGFVDAGKEPCWALSEGGNPWNHFSGCAARCDGNTPKFAALDGCPYYHSRANAKVLWCRMPQTKLILLVRDPVERLISHFNEKVARQSWRGQSPGTDIDKWITTSITSRDALLQEHIYLSDFAGGLENFLRFFDSSQFMVIRTEKMKGSNEHVQAFMDAVFEFCGVANRQVVTEMSYVRKTSATYIVPSPDVIQKAVAFFRPMNEQLFRLVGARWKMHYFDE